MTKNEENLCSENKIWPCIENLRYFAKDITVINKIFQKMDEGIVVTNDQAEIIYVNKNFELISEYSCEEAIGKNPSVLQSGLHDETYYEVMWENLLTKGYWEGEIWNQKKSGTIYPEWLEIFAVVTKEDKRFYVALFTDISHKNESRDIRLIDELTGISNRKALNIWLESLLQDKQTKTSNFSVIHMNLDRFKIINNSLGHRYGDELLKQFSKRVMGLLENGDFLARYGGDEFVVVLTGLRTKEEVKSFCRKILSKIKEAFNIFDEDLYITTSIGISSYPDDGRNADELLRNADKATYEAKQLGRNTFRFYVSELHFEEQRTMEIEKELRNAIKNNELYLNYHPIINVEDKSIAAVEALLRWKNDKLGFVSPGEFIPIAEETGLIIPISEWVIDQALKQLNRIHESGYPYLKMCINISAVHFHQDYFTSNIKEHLERNKVKRQHVILELTEGMLMSRESEDIDKLVKLKQLGIRIAIDDFGTGYSSLSYLNRFPIDILKIDQSFIKDLHNYTENVAIVKTIIALAKILNLEIIAEGVESKWQYDFLQEEACKNIQGFFISKPMSEDDLLDFLYYWDPSLL